MPSDSADDEHAKGINEARQRVWDQLSAIIDLSIYANGVQRTSDFTRIERVKGVSDLTEYNENGRPLRSFIVPLKKGKKSHRRQEALKIAKYVKERIDPDRLFSDAIEELLKSVRLPTGRLLGVAIDCICEDVNDGMADEVEREASFPIDQWIHTWETLGKVNGVPRLADLEDKYVHSFLDLATGALTDFASELYRPSTNSAYRALEKRLETAMANIRSSFRDWRRLL